MEQTKTGELRVTNKELLDSQKGIFIEIAKRLLWAVFSRDGVTSMSLPIRMFEPRSTLERIADFFATLGTYCLRAAETTDPVERLKYIMTACVSGLVTSPSLKKPFNPYLGETF